MLPYLALPKVEWKNQHSASVDETDAPIVSA
jgi:hypothetical protein